LHVDDVAPVIVSLSFSHFSGLIVTRDVPNREFYYSLADGYFALPVALIQTVNNCI
jgi:hypothetical protein